MKPLLLLVFLALAIYINAFEREESYYISAFSKFKQEYSRNYATIEEESKRYAIFKENVDWINNHNKLGLSYTVGINNFADITNEEYRATYLKFRPSKNQNFRSWKAPKHLDKPGDLPDSVDWRQQKAVSYIKDQGQCGSCWSFSTSGAIEGTIAIKNKKLLVLTEQQIIDCSWDAPYNNEGCDGGDMRAALQYILDTTGIESEDVYPYVDYNGGDKHKCKYTAAKKSCCD